MKAVLLCMLLFFSLSLSQRTIQFDPTQEQNCVTNDGCSFLDPSIWINNTVPSLPTDIVIITGSDNSDLTINFPSNVSVNVYSLTLTNALLVLNENATLQVTIFNFGDNSQFNTEVNSTFLVDPQGTSRSVSVLNMTMNYKSTWEINGYVLVNTAVYLLGDITLEEYAQVFLDNVFYYPNSISTDYFNLYMGTVNIPHYATVSFDDGLIAFFLNVSNNATVNFNSNVNISQIYVAENSTINFINALVFLGPSAYTPPNRNQASLSSIPVGPEVLPPLTGAATSRVVSSQSSAIYILGDSTFTYAGSLSTDVLSRFYFQNIQLSVGFLTAAIIVADGFEFNGTVTADQQLIVVGNGVTVNNGSLWISGTANVSTSITVHTGSILNFGTTYDVTYGPNAALYVGGILSGQNVSIPSWASLVATSVNTSIQVTNLLMDGTMDASKGNRFIMGGNLIFGPQSNLLATLRTEFDAPVFVIGNIVLNGNASYSLTKIPHSNKKYALIDTLGNLGITPYTLTGRFLNDKAKALHESAVDRDLALEYTSDTVFVKYNLSVKDIPTWIWIVGGVAVAAAIVLIIAIIAICVVKRRRHDYKPVR